MAFLRDEPAKDTNMETEPIKAPAINVLLVEDNPGDARLIEQMLSETGGVSFDLEWVERLSEGLERTSAGDIDVVLLDLSLPDSQGLDTFTSAYAHAPQVPIILLTGLDDEESAVRAVREGAQDYLVKGQVEGDLLVRAIQYAIERKQAERALIQAAQLWQDTFDAIENMVAILDRDCRVVRANRAMKEAFAGQKVIGAHCYGLFHGTEEPVSECTTCGTFRTGEAAHMERHEEHLGNRWISTSTYPITERDGTVQQVVHVAHDITEQKHTEERIQRQNRLTAVGQLGAGIAHDFNNLLTGIIGYAELASEELDPNSKVYQYIAAIPKLGSRGADLTRQLLTFSRQTAVTRKPMDLVPLVKEVAKMLQRTLPEHIVIQTTPSQRVATINADPTQIQQVIMNLCVNAGQAMPEGGELTLEAATVVLDEEYSGHHPDVTPGEHVCLSVRDTGVGMTSEVQERIFEPFFTTKEVGEGTGLGLSVVYGIVKSHEGHIGFYSEVGRGTEFNIYFPSIDAEEAREEVSAKGPLPIGTENLLFVEDEPMVLRAGRAMLESLGYTVLTAKDGEEGLKAYLAHWDEVALVLTDMVMPRMGGRELCEALTRINPEVKIVLVSGYSLNQSLDDLRASGFRGFVHKPFRVDDLARTVREVLDE